MPYSNWYVVASPPGFTVPVTAAEPVVIDSAPPVVAVGGGLAARDGGEEEGGDVHDSVRTRDAPR